MKKDYTDEREQAYQLFLQGKKYKEIADEVGVTLSAVKSWASRYWKSEKVATNKDKKVATFEEKVATKRKRGGQPGNKNATGPPRNQNARKHGLFSKWLPADINEIIGEMPDDELDILWHNIQLQYATIIRSQKDMWIEDEIYDGVQSTWNKQVNFMSSLSRAMKTLEGMISRYDELVHKNWELATEEQKARLDLLKAQKDKLTGENQEVEDLTETDEMIYGNS